MDAARPPSGRWRRRTIGLGRIGPRTALQIGAAGELQVEILGQLAVEHGGSQNGDPSVVVDQPDGLIGRHLLPGDEAGRQVADVPGKGLFDGGDISLLHKVAGEVGPGPDAAGKGLRHGRRGDLYAVLLELFDDGQVPTVPGTLKFLEASVK